MSSSPPPSSSSSRIDEGELELRLFEVYSQEVKMCDGQGQSTQHIGDEWMRREIRRICGFDVSDRWIKLFRRKHGIRYFSGRRHAADKANKLIPLAAASSAPSKVKSSNFLKERRILRTSRKEYDDVDSRVHAEIRRRQSLGERLTNPWIRDYAHGVGVELHPHANDIDKFFDANWLYRFKRRYCVELKPRGNLQIGKESPPSLDEKPEDFYNRMLIQNYVNMLKGGDDVSK
uniref:HTH CENPB-type domain-containing protein n=1 Tax=Caenorhabditis tropicalis TaxID=1561998 RepID=A0A1I7UC02_9PELO